MSNTPSSSSSLNSGSSPRTPEEYITNLAGRYDTLLDIRTISGQPLQKKFASYIYSRRLLIRKTLADDPTHHQISCTHCTRGTWIVESRSTTSSLQIRHFRTRHKSLPLNYEEEKKILDQLQLSKVGSAETPFSLAHENSVSTRKQLDRFDNKILRDHISRFLVNTNTSLSIVENPSFLQLLQYCNPSVSTISRRTASRDIKALHLKLLPRIQAILHKFTVIDNGRVSLTLDAWTSSTQVPFLGITCHFIEPSTWKHQSLLLGFERLSGSHSAQALGKVTLSILNQFNIAGAIRAITADSASVNTAMFRNLEKEGLMSGFTQKDCHIRCMGHVINLAVQILLKVLKTTAADNEAKLADEDEEGSSKDTQLSQASFKARKIIAKVRASTHLWEALQAQALAARIPSRRPIIDMPVRWNSTYSMLERLLELRPAIDAVCRFVFHIYSIY